MKITEVKIKNYRNLKDVDVKWGNIVTLIGENNSGKSNFLRAISLPLSSEDNGTQSKRLSWFDINNDAKNEYYDFLSANKDRLLLDSFPIEEFEKEIPEVNVELTFEPEEKEHYYVKDILSDTEKLLGSVKYRYYVKDPAKLLSRTRELLKSKANSTNIRMSLLPMEFYTFSIVVPKKESKVPYDTLSNFRVISLPAERDNFASSADKLGSKALSDLLQKHVNPESQVSIEEAYNSFFNTIKQAGQMDSILNWQEYSSIPNADQFFHKISILPNLPQMSSILGSIRLGYEDENMYMQGLGYRNLILMVVLLNSYLNSGDDTFFRVVTVEEPEAHLDIGNILLIASFLNYYKDKNKSTQIIFSTHNSEFVNKMGLDKVLVFHHGILVNSMCKFNR